MSRPPATETTIVVPTVGRSSLGRLLEALARQAAPLTAPVIVVDDRVDRTAPLPLPPAPPVRVVVSGGRGPAAARNLGWRKAATPWVSFLDDDVLPPPDWFGRLRDDLAGAGSGTLAIQGRVEVPLPSYRPATDWERNTARLAGARWITADMSVRRTALRDVGGFDERFRRAYREDSDLALRLEELGSIAPGERMVRHPARPAGFWASVRAQAGNADDVLMRRLHGPRWRRRIGEARGRRLRHLGIVAGGLVAAAGVATGRRLPGVAGGLLWSAGTAELARARIAPGPRTASEVTRMLVTSLAIPWAAVWHSGRGLWRWRHAAPWHGLPELVLFDRDGTLVVDVPYNGDPGRVRPVPGAAEALTMLRERGVPVGMATNQSAIGLGLISRRQAEAVNRRVAELLGPFDVTELCPHAPDDGCPCRKPAAGMVLSACRRAGATPTRSVLVGDTAADVGAARAAGAMGVLVPNAATRVEETRDPAATLVAPALADAVAGLLSGVLR